MGHEDEESDGHGRECLCETFVLSSEELLQCDEVSERLAHFLSVDGDHVVVHPVFHHVVSLRCNCLCYLTFVVGEYKVHAAAVNVELFAQVLASHGCALAVPSGKSFAPWAWPVHDVLRFGFFPKSEVGLVVLLANSGQ